MDWFPVFVGLIGAGTAAALNVWLYRLHRRLAKVMKPAAGPWPSPPPGDASPPVQANPTQAGLLPLRDDIIIGYRTYAIEWEDGRPWLHGSQVRWEERRFVAECSDSVLRCTDHLATLECSCGIYAHKAPPPSVPPGHVEAVCVLYGVVWPHTEGWRASNVRIESLAYHAVSPTLVPLEQELCDLLALHYEVPVKLVTQVHVTYFPDQPYFPPPRGGPSGGVAHRAGPSYHSVWSTQ